MGNQRLDGLLGARYGLDPGFSPNLAITPDGAEVWVTHKGSGRTSVIDARRLQLLTVLDTGPVTNHVNFVAKPDGIFAYVTVGQTNKTLVFRTNGANPVKVDEMPSRGCSSPPPERAQAI